MGRLVEGEWQTESQLSESDSFERAESTFRDWLTPPTETGEATAGGAEVPASAKRFPAAEDRYHLYVAWACPWAHRALIFRALKGLEELIPVSIVQPIMGEQGWVFDEPADATGAAARTAAALPEAESTQDHVEGKRALYQVYQAADRSFSGRVTVPVLWDRTRNTIVNNESADIARILNAAFDDLGARPGDYYPASQRDEIDALNDRIYETVNNGVYRAGFAKSQQAYEEALDPLFDTLDWLETRLTSRRYLLGEATTEADWRLLPTLLRFDAVYAVHFKCSVRRIVDYPNLWAYTRDLYQHPGIARTFQMAPTVRHYYGSHGEINPTGIVARPPSVDLTAPHGRD